MLGQRSGLLRVWVFLSLWWIVGMGIIAVLDGVPEPTSVFKVTTPFNDPIEVTAPTRLSRDDVRAYVKDNYKQVQFCHSKKWACVDSIVLEMPLRTLRPRTVLYMAVAIAIPAMALVLGLIAASTIGWFAREDSRFGNTLIVSTVSAGLAVFAQLVLVLEFYEQAEPAWGLTAQFSLVCALLCMVVFVVGLFLFRRRGLWLALPMFVAFALPVALVTYLAVETYDCRKHNPNCEL